MSARLRDPAHRWFGPAQARPLSDLFARSCGDVSPMGHVCVLPWRHRDDPGLLMNLHSNGGGVAWEDGPEPRAMSFYEIAAGRCYGCGREAGALFCEACVAERSKGDCT